MICFSRLVLNIENQLVSELIKCVFKEASKSTSDSVYKTSSLRCLTDLIQFSTSQLKDSFFEDYWTSFVLKFFDKDLDTLRTKETRQTEILKAKLEGREEPVQEAQASQGNDTDKQKTEENQDVEMEEKEAEESTKLIILETIGKCWSYSSELQG